MNRDDIIRMAQEAGCTPRRHPEYWDDVQVFATPNVLERFAALVAAAEREACAQVCDEKVDAEYATGKVDHNEMGWTQACAIDIRSRGQA